MMSLLTICQNVANAIPIEVPSVIVGNAAETASLLLACAQHAGKQLARRPKNGWLDMVVEYTFSTVASQADYNLPSDFKWLVQDTLWDRSNYEEMRGPLTPQQWQEYKSSVLATTNTTWKRYRIRNVSGTTKFSIHPTPGAVENLVFVYVSKNWCESSGGTGQAAWAADTDTGILDEYLIELDAKWRMMNRLGMAYDEEYEEAQREISQAIARDGGAPKLLISGRHRYNLLGPQNIPDSGYGS